MRKSVSLYELRSSVETLVALSLEGSSKKLVVPSDEEIQRLKIYFAETQLHLRHKKPSFCN